jgi:hypothetical protein
MRDLVEQALEQDLARVEGDELECESKVLTYGYSTHPM